MEECLLGQMPIEAFFEEFLPPGVTPLPEIPKGTFQDGPKDGQERAAYDEFIDMFEPWMPHLQAVNTSNREEDAGNDLEPKTDIAIYEREGGMVIPDRTDFSRVELWLEFKTKTQEPASYDPEDSEACCSANEVESFVPNTIQGIETRSQMAQCAGAQHSLQFRHFSFSILVEGDNSRFLRWDRAGTIVTAAFNYRENAKVMAEFLWRFNHMSPSQRGHDESVQLAELKSEDDARVKKKLEIMDNNVALYRYTIPSLEGKGYAYGPRPPTTNHVFPGKSSQITPAVWVPTCMAGDGVSELCAKLKPSGEQEEPWHVERLIFLKDTWRHIGVKIMPEHEVYEILHKHNTPNIPELVAGGDVVGGKTRTQKFVSTESLHVQAKVLPLHHYRLVLGVVGQPLFMFQSTKQLVTGVLDALKAHSHAFKLAKLLHRDISVGNIILTDKGRGLLIDWETAEEVTETSSRRPDRVGTWQFMSGNLLGNPHKTHNLMDDLESFLHVLAWITLHYVPAKDGFRPIDRAADLNMMFDHYLPVEGQLDKGGLYKRNAFRAGIYPSDKFKPRECTPLTSLFTNLSMPFQSLYTTCPPTKDASNSGDYNEDIQKLTTSSFFIKEIQQALDNEAWPVDDKADLNLPIAPLTHFTEGQSSIRTNWHQIIQGTSEDSIGLSQKRKHASSALSQPQSPKRHHKL